MSFDKVAFLAALLPVITTIDVDGFGPVRLRQISVAENDAIRQAAKDGGQASDFGMRLVAASVVDDDGNLVFTEAELQALRASAASKIDPLVVKVLELNGHRKAADAKNDAS